MSFARPIAVMRPSIGDDRIGIEDRVLDRARQHQADIADDQLGRSDVIGGSVMGHATILS